MVDTTNLTVLIPTNGRPSCLMRCLDSICGIENSIIYVLDSTDYLSGKSKKIRIEYDSVYEKHSHIHVINHGINIPPGASRKILARLVKTEYLIFLDDDLIVHEGSIESMRKLIESDESIGIVSGIWIEKGMQRPIGYRYSRGQTKNRKLMLKSQVYYDPASNDDFVFVDEALPSLLMKSDLLETVNFDDRYDFYYDIFDFFMQCYFENIRTVVDCSAVFEHRPLKYKVKSTRHHNDPNVDRARFVDKWMCYPILSPRPVPFSERLYRLFRRISL